VKSVQRCTALATLLAEQNFPAIAIHRGMLQEERLDKYQKFKNFEKVNQYFWWLSLVRIDGYLDPRRKGVQQEKESHYLGPIS